MRSIVPSPPAGDARLAAVRSGFGGFDTVAVADESGTNPALFIIADRDGNTILVDQHV